jgi:poly(3-hydroxyalkanoate) synthetase
MRTTLQSLSLNTLNLSKLTQSAKFVNLTDRLLHPERLIQAGKTLYNVIKGDVQGQGLIKLRHYPALAGYPTRHRVPLVIVPPLAINMLIYDLFEHRSLVRYLLEQGFSVYMLDWGTPTRAHTDYNFEQYILDYMPKLLAQVRVHSGQQQLSLHSWSMSGVFALLYAAATQDPNIKNLIVLGTPIDSYKSGDIGAQMQKLAGAVNWIEHHTRFHPRNLSSKLIHTAGWMNALSFMVLDVNGTLKGHLNMLRQLDNRTAVASHATHGAFLNHMVDYPGGINRDMMIKVWLDNSLSTGQFKIGGKVAYLKDIHAATLVGAGRSDTMVTTAAVRPLTKLVGSDDVTFSAIPGGHVSMIGSEAAANEFWPELATWLAVRSD